MAQMGVNCVAGYEDGLRHLAVFEPLGDQVGVRRSVSVKLAHPKVGRRPPAALAGFPGFRPEASDRREIVSSPPRPTATRLIPIPVMSPASFLACFTIRLDRLAAAASPEACG